LELREEGEEEDEEKRREMKKETSLFRKIPYKGGFPKPWARAHGIQTHRWVAK